MMKPPDVAPPWYCDFQIPEGLNSTILPLVHLIGLDAANNPIHRFFWETLTMKNPAKDFQPKYVNIPLDHKYREKKMKTPDSMECYIPRGIMKANWVQKYKEDIPSAVVTFFDMNWSDPNWNERKTELARQIKLVKSNLVQHGTQVLVMLMKAPGSGDDNFTTDRASSFCAAAEIPPKYLFVLAHTNTDRIQACVQRLEIGMREISKAYYSARIKKVRGWKDKVTVTPLLVRYNLKIGIFQEIRRDLVAAITHYQGAYEALITIKVTDANVQELKMVASILTYRIIGIYLTKGEGKEAKVQFDKHIRSFLKIEGNKEIVFEHYAWLSHQYQQFADLLKQFYWTNKSSIPDPISYFISAGKYVQKRRENFEQSLKLYGTPIWPSEMNPYNGSVPVKLQCIGQRPWWNNPFNQDYLYAVEDKNTILALLYFESLCNHSDQIISNWGIASEVCRLNQHLRTRCQLMSMMGTEFLKVKQHSKCVMLMTHILREFGQEDWKSIIHSVATCGYNAALAIGDINAYCNFLLILLKMDIVDYISKQRRLNLWTNLQSLLNGQFPPVTDDVDLDVTVWNKILSESWTSYVEIHNSPILECEVTFVDDVIFPTENVIVMFTLRNKSEFPLCIQKYGIRTNASDHESTTQLTINSQEEKTVELSFTALPRDISKSIQIQVAYVDIGTSSRSILLHYSQQRTTQNNFYLWMNSKLMSQKAIRSSVRIEQSKPMIKVNVLPIDPFLVNAWNKVIVSVINTGPFNYGKVTVACHVQTLDTQGLVLAYNPNDENFDSTKAFAKEFLDLEANQEIKTELFVKPLVPFDSNSRLQFKVKYVDQNGLPVAVEHIQDLEARSPFDVHEEVTNLYGLILQSVSVNEDCLLKCIIRNNSGMNLVIIESSLDLQLPVQFRHELTGGPLPISLKPDEKWVNVSWLTSSLPNSNSPGFLQLKWKSEADDLEMEFTSALNPINFIVDTSLHLLVEFSNNGYGKLKHPMIGFYTLINRTTFVFDVMIVMDSTELFMHAGPKRLSIKLFGNEEYKFNYVLFPLVTGRVEFPKVSFFTPPNGSTILEPIPLTIHHDSPKTIFIMA